MRGPRLWICLLLAACAEAPSSAPYERALEHVRRGEYGAAQAASQEAIRREPHSPGPYRVAGFLAAVSGRRELALRAFHQVLELDPGDPAAHNDLACLYADLGQFRRAQAHLQQALAAAPDLVLLRYNAGRLSEFMGEYAAAASQYERALELGEDARTREALGRLSIKEDRLPRAGEHFARALELDPGARGAHYGLGQVRALQERHTEAIAHFRRATAIDSTFIDAHYALALSCERLGLREESRAAFARFQALGPRPMEQALLVLSDPQRTYARGGRGGVAPPAMPPAGQAPLRFVDAAESAGLDFVHTSGAGGQYYMIETMGPGLCFVDFDGDGLQDLYLVDGHALPRSTGQVNRLYRNLGDGRFAEVPGAAGAADPGYGMGCAVADYDGDGDEDLYATNFGANALYRNDGGRFVRVAEAANPLWSSSAGFVDADGDGDVDLYVANYLDYELAKNIECGQYGYRDYCHPDKYAAAADAFYRNDGDRFVEASAAAGLVAPGGKGLGVATSDYDGDGDVDIYVANDRTPNFLYRNDGGRFADVGLEAGAAFDAHGFARAGMGVAFGDYDGDGRADIFVTNFAYETNALYRNEGAGRFADVGLRVGLAEPSLPMVGFGAHFFDCDNDGDEDIFAANGHILAQVEKWNDAITYAQPNQLFLNEGGVFRDVSAVAGEGLKAAHVSRGSAVADYDGDGDLDVAVANNGGPVQLLRNDLHRPGNWLRVRASPGARIEVETVAGRQWREAGAASSYLSAGEGWAHFGLGNAVRAGVRVRWPGGRVQELGHVDANQQLVARAAAR